MVSPLQPTQSEEDVTVLLLARLQSPQTTPLTQDQQTIREAQRVITEEINPNTVLVGDVKLQKFLTYFLSEAPNPLYVARALTADYDLDEPRLRGVQGEKKCMAVAEIWFQRFIKFLKTERAKSKTPPPSTVITPSIQSTSTMIKCGTRSQAQLTKWLMNRDGQRDVIRKCLSQHSDIAGPITVTISAHILPFSAGGWDENQPPPVHKQIFWDILRNWADFNIEELKGDLINRPGNALTLESVDNYFFGRLELWFEETTTVNEYQVRVKDPSMYNFPLALQQTVTFKNHCAKCPIELPIPALLRIHAAAARVLHLSGAGDYLDRVERERELNDLVLAKDGSSIALLDETLRDLVTA